VLATNAFTHQLHGLNRLKAARQQNPMIVHASVTEPLRDEHWSAVGWSKRFGVNVVSDLFYSFAPTSDGRLVYVGGYYLESPERNELGPEVSLPFKVEGHAHLESFFPALKGLQTTQTWGGPISTTLDFIPHVGEMADSRVAYGVGCWGHGMPLGARNGRTLAELALGRRTESTQMWFVNRRPDLWPSRFLATYGTRRVAQLRRITNRRIGSAMVPPLQFGAAAPKRSG
jgi:glycine/D-amino acid oxidase-like deaminating enzyme